jgi:replicative DNA helicase
MKILTQKRERFENTPIDDIYLYYKQLIDSAAAECSMDLGYTESEAIGDFDEYLSFLQDNAYGLPFSSAFLNTVTRGQQRGKLYVISASSGVGKTRNLIGNLCHSFAKFL